MGDISKGEGRTVLFVSHNMAAVKSLCNKGILLENGTITHKGNSDDVINQYIKNENNNASVSWNISNSPKSQSFALLGAKVLNHNGKISLNHLISDDIVIEFSYQVLQNDQLFTHGFNLFNNQNIHILSSHDIESESLIKPISKGLYTKKITIPKNFLSDGGYSCSFAIMRYNPFHVEIHQHDVVGFNIIDDLHSISRGRYSGNLPGVVRPSLKWT